MTINEKSKKKKKYFIEKNRAFDLIYDHKISAELAHL